MKNKTDAILFDSMRSAMDDIFGPDKCRALAAHIEAMATDAHFCEHPEWHELVKEARAILAEYSV